MAVRKQSILTWLCWWALLMAFWVMLDDSFRPDELLVGAGGSALAALLATAVSNVAFSGSAVKDSAVKDSAVKDSDFRGSAVKDSAVKDSDFRGSAVKDSAVRGSTGWLRQAAYLPGQVLRDTGAVYVALGRMVVQGGPPPGGYTEIPVRYGDGTTHGIIRRVLLTWARSLAPNTFVVGMDPERDVMVIHRLAGGATAQDGEP
jgi:hypothetical protein